MTSDRDSRTDIGRLGPSSPSSSPFTVSALAFPYGARLDAGAKFQGMSSSMRLLGCPSSKARNVAVR